MSYVWCYNNLGLVKLPNWETVKDVNCRYCPNLSSLPCWPNVTKVDCDNCTRLLLIPNWPQHVQIEYKNCPNVQKHMLLVVLQTDFLQSAWVPEFINL